MLRINYCAATKRLVLQDTDHLCVFLELPISALAREGKLAIFLISVFAIDDQACI